MIPTIRNGKFVQVNKDRSDYLILSPKELSKYHANIVERFCKQNNIDGYYNKEYHIFEIVDPVCEVIGGGKWKIDDQDKRIHLFDDSQAYGKFNTIGLKDKILSDKQFNGYQIRID